MQKNQEKIMNFKLNYVQYKPTYIHVNQKIKLKKQGLLINEPTYESISYL